MVRDGDPSSLWVAKDFVAPRLSHLNKPELLDDANGLCSSEAWQTLTHTASSSVVTLMDSSAGRF